MTCTPIKIASVLVLLSVLSGMSLGQGGAPTGATLVINEFLAHNTGSFQDAQGDSDDWIELYNHGNSPVNVAGYYLTDDMADPTRWQFPTSDAAVTTVPAHGFLLIWADSEVVQGLLHANFKLSAGGESLALYDGQLNLLDAVTFGAQEPDASFGRMPDGADSWQSFTTPTPGRSNQAGTGQIVISEIMFHPPHAPLTPEDRRQEWIELCNTGVAPVPLAGWQLTDGVEYVFPDVVLKGGGCLVVAADTSVFTALHPDVQNVVGGWTGWLSNSGERIVLADEVGEVVDEVRYADEGDWAVRELGPVDHSHRGWQWSDETDGGGRSLELIGVAMPNEFGQNWAASLVDGGTPGAANSVAAGDVAPLILNLRHSPVIPKPVHRVTVTARVIDEAMQSVVVRLCYRVDRSTYSGDNAYPQTGTDYLSVVMVDDGAHGDGAAGDGVYGAQIPPHPDGTVIEFYVEAIDGGGRARTWPAPSLVDDEWRQVTNALYRVDAALDPGTYWQVGGQPLYYLVMTEMERAHLAFIDSRSNGEEDSDATMNGVFVSIDGTGVESCYRVGIRNRGHGTRTGPPNNYHVGFARDRRWKGLSAINFNCRYTYAQIIGSVLFRMAGTAAAEAAPAQLRINGANLAASGSPMFGVYVRLDAFDEDFAAKYFPEDPDGNLYACFRDAGEADFRYLGANPNAYRPSYFKESNVSQDDWSDLIRLVNVLNNAPDASYEQEVGEVINISQWLHYIALDACLLNYETGLRMGIGDDYYLYRGVTDPRFVLIPHDLDTILGQGNTSGAIDQSIFTIVTGIGSYNGVDGLKRLFGRPDIIRRYYQAVLDVTDQLFRPERLDPLFDQVLGAFTPADHIATLKQFVRDRRAAVLDQIPQQLTVDNPLPVVDGYPYTTSDKYVLSGAANVATTLSVLVDGIPASWSAMEGRWQSAGSLGVADSLVDAGSEWKYLDDGSDQGTAWRSSGFDDSTWRTGEAQLGYGDNDEATVIDGGPSGDRFITAYFRKSFPVRTLEGYFSLHLRVLCDDGAVIYLNNVEAWRVGMPEGAIDYTTRASAGVSGDAERTFVECDLPVSLLRAGVNVLAVEVHQNAPSSGDMSFDLGLEAIRPSVNRGSLQPGINRVVVESCDGRNGTGTKLQEKQIDIWYDDGDISSLSGAIASDRTLQAAAGPWQVTGAVTVPAGVTLTIEPGTTLFFEPGAGLVVNGRLIAEGTAYQRISLTKTPGSTSWAGLQFKNTTDESRLAYVTMEYCDSGSAAIEADHARVAMDHVVWANHSKMYLSFDDSSMILKNSILPSIQNEELVHFWGMPSDGYALIEGNWFGTTTGYNDIIDFTGGQRPGPIGRFLNNTFTGASDDGIDLDAADAHVEGNVFLHMHQDASRETLTHAVTTGTEYGECSRVTAVRNLFYDVDHAFLSKDDGFITAVNNTVVHATFAVANMYEARSGQWQGMGFYGDGNIFHDVAHVFANPDWVGHPTAITMNNSIFPIIENDPVVWDGTGNLEGVNPLLVNDGNITDPLRDMRLLPSSPAIGTGANGRDMGGLVPAGASISGEPAPVTWKTSVTLTVGGPDIHAYKYRVNNGPWSEEVVRPDALLAGNPRPLPPITLANLQNGQSYTVYVVGKDSAGVWQSQDHPTVSRTFVVDTAYRQLLIHEILAVNETEFDHEGAFPDLVELYYDGPAPLSLAGMTLSDDPGRPDKYVFPAGVLMNPGEYRVLFADDDATASGLHLGFAFGAGGDALYLHDKTGALIDSVEFGPQLPDLSIGRVGNAGQWHLTVPTFGQANLLMPLGDPRTVKINEWLASGEVLFSSDFVELYNPDALPVDLGGFHISDTPEREPDRYGLSPLSFVAGRGHVVFEADGKAGPGHLGFSLSADGEVITLFDTTFSRIDQIVFGNQTADVSQGRSPDGSGRFEYFLLPTPGLPNMTTSQESVTSVALVPESAAKSAFVPTSADEVGEAWKSDVGFDDSAWLHGAGAPGGVGFDRGSDYDSLITLDTEAQMYGTGKNSSCYVRVPFTVDADTLADVNSLMLKVRYDDAFIAYLNGQEVARTNFTGTPAWNSRADSAGEAEGEDFDEYVDITRFEGDLKPGANLLAVHAMNSSVTSSDFLISVAVDATLAAAQGGNLHEYKNDLNLLDALRITELMYHSRQGAPYDYVELMNAGDAVLDVTGVRLSEGVRFTFPAMTLEPGEYVVVVADLASFRSAYGAAPRVAGQYSGSLSNAGEEIVLQLPVPLDAVILRFDYDGAWYPLSDGDGMSLTIRDPAAPRATWSDPASWQQSQPSPGRP